jgi:hypothetical protein
MKEASLIGHGSMWPSFALMLVKEDEQWQVHRITPSLTLHDPA